MTLALLVLAALVPGALAPGALAPCALAPGPAAQSILEGEALRFAQAWEGEDLRLLGELMAEDGIRLHLPGEDHVLIRPRQARAALGAFLERYAGGEADLTRVSLAGGDLGKGFAEIRWRTGSPGVPEPVVFTLFVAFSSENDRWSVTEIRVLF
ncbi:MAG: nuclear transport factor 2 family protein [Gemmatimonadota bacterium]